VKYKDRIEKVYFKATGRGEISACARFLGIDQAAPRPFCPPASRTSPDNLKSE
jgi:hypothetical protein